MRLKSKYREPKMPSDFRIGNSQPLRPLDIIIPIYKNADLVRICVESVLRHLGEIADHCPRVVLINDSPGDEAVESLLRAFRAKIPAMRIMQNATNLGFVGAVNLGLEEAMQSGHDVLLVNSDTQTFAGTLSELLRGAFADPQIGFACPRSNNASICSLPHFFGGSIPTPEISHARWLEISRTMPAYHFAPTAVGFYMFISHRVLANHGGLQSEFGVGYEEENDLVMRAGELGSRAVIVNRSFAYHAGSASFSLKDLDLAAHKHKNLLKLAGYHPQFLPLVSRYENSPHYRAEQLMAGILPGVDGKIKVAFDLSGMGQHYNGTNEMTVSALKSMAARHCDRIRLTGVASAETFRSHSLDKVPEIIREEPGSSGLHGVAVLLAQPFDLHQINTLEALAPINVFAMLDTIAEDCGRLALDGGFLELWDHVSEHANGLVFNSRFSEVTFCNRHSAALRLPRWASLLATRASSYPKPQASSEAEHILVVGNHFAHKGSDVAARVIAAALPALRIVVLGAETGQSGNLTSHRSGALKPAMVERLFADASIVVLPSHVEGFGLGLMHALAAGRPVVARRIPATDEILETLDDVTGVFLFDDNKSLIPTCMQALTCSKSSANYDRALSWDDWADGLTDFCLSMVSRDDLFDRLVGRIAAGDRLRRAIRGDDLGRCKADGATKLQLSDAKPTDLHSLLALDGAEFVEHAYATLLCRPVDGDGLKAYMDQMAMGLHKLDILDALSKSPEGRQRDVVLPGLQTLMLEHRKSQKSLIKRIFGN